VGSIPISGGALYCLLIKFSFLQKFYQERSAKLHKVLMNPFCQADRIIVFEGHVRLRDVDGTKPAEILLIAQ
jgi:hypothetical protein